MVGSNSWWGVDMSFHGSCNWMVCVWSGPLVAALSSVQSPLTQVSVRTLFTCLLFLISLVIHSFIGHLLRQRMVGCGSGSGSSSGSTASSLGAITRTEQMIG
eukprot:GHVU01138604.1.p2 GENE.GHVU01138604.1~~GHVU01138604.1.p2  ORF type:complete len:102 (+),score=7.32 GHVU01138604.1:349-654(+)